MNLKKRAEMGMGLLIDNRDEPLINRVEGIIRETIEACAKIADEEETYYRKMIPNMKGDSIVWHHGAAKAARHLGREIRKLLEEKA